MVNKIMKFISEEFGNVRGIYLNGQAWLYATDVCKCLDIKNSRDAVTRLKDTEILSYVVGKRKAKNGVTNTVGNTDGNAGAVCGWIENRVNLINEPGLYRLIMTSRKPEAEEFQYWVYHEVLPAIRRTGEYQLERDEARTGGKAIRRKLTDTIKEFLEYLKERGELDRAPVAWYSAFSNLINKTVGVEKGNRDNLTALQLFRIQDAEDIAAAIIEAGMTAGKGHHDIWVACQEKLDGRNDVTKIFGE